MHLFKQAAREKTSREVDRILQNKAKKDRAEAAESTRVRKAAEEREALRRAEAMERLGRQLEAAEAAREKAKKAEMESQKAVAEEESEGGQQVAESAPREEGEGKESGGYRLATNQLFVCVRRMVDEGWIKAGTSEGFLILLGAVSDDICGDRWCRLKRKDGNQKAGILRLRKRRFAKRGALWTRL
jgi:hypothetical protein